MSYLEIVLIAIGLAMDAFAVSISKGLTLKKMEWGKALLCGAYFGGFQALMPLVGFLLGSGFKSLIEDYDHWVAFILLAAIGISMIRGAGDETELESGFGFRTMVILAIATSIDALAVGISFAVLKVNIIAAILMIGIITFVISMLGVNIGSVFGNKYKKRAELAGGVILILIGFKILMEHLGVLG